MANPDNFNITSDFASSGSDGSVLITLNIPAQSIPIQTDRVISTSVPSPTNFEGRQIRANITTNQSGATIFPGAICATLVPVTFSGGSGGVYCFIDTYRSGQTIVLRARIANQLYPPSTINSSAFTITAEVRTVVVN